MLKKISEGLVTAAFVLGAAVFVFAQTQEYDTKTAASEISKTEDVGNKICPVSGEKIDEKMKAAYEYNGKIYNFCCPMCIEEFKKDPQKYIKKIEEELGTASKEETDTMRQSQEPAPGTEMHQEHEH